MFRISCLVFVVVLAIKAIATEGPRLNLWIYYESLCPDSEDFIKNQLQPTMDVLGQYIHPVFIPFGKAHNVNEEYFICQHGEPECRGNLIQSCALYAMNNSSDKARLDYVTCEMVYKTGTMGRFDCVEQAGIDTHQVQECISSGRGLQMQLYYEKLTNQVSPQFIPTVAIDGIFDPAFQETALYNLEGALCQNKLIDVPKCAQYGR